MDDGRIEKVIRKREKNYIYLEREWKLRLVINTAVIAVFFFLMRILNPSFRYYWPFCIAALLINGILNYLMYKREYSSYLSIARYLEEFELGNYEYHEENDYMKTGIHSQLTEQMERMGNAFERLKSRLIEEKENTKVLVTDIAHQLKTPNAAIAMIFELMDDPRITEEEKREIFMRGQREVQKLSYLMGTLTNLSRLEAEAIQLHAKEGSLKQTLVQAVNGVYLKAGDKDIEIEMCDFKDIALSHDAKWTAEGIANVLDNAVKYSPEHTKIQIRVEVRTSYICIEVEDEGIGIPQTERMDIFKRFYRGNSSEVEATEGAGVGLYLVRRILEEQGGSVRTVSAGRKGTIVQMMLPKNYSGI